MKVSVGSKNPVKLRSVELAFEALWPDIEWQFSTCSVPSGVRDQPMSDEEATTGARNRARHALAAHNAEYGVGLEGGLHNLDGRWFDAGWGVVVDAKGNEGIGSTIRMQVPSRIMKLLDAGYELGDACDAVFDSQNAKQGPGFYGLMTNGILDRTVAYRDAVITALAPFINRELFEQ